MPASLQYSQACPTCGRRLQVRVELLGRPVACQHCQAEFTARDPDQPSREVCDSALLDRVENALRRASRYVASQMPPTEPVGTVRR